MKTYWGSATATFLTLLALIASTGARAGDGKRQKVIDFEDEVVEGVNKRPWDSLSQISESDRRKRKPHLYRKRASFVTETSDALRTLASTP
jgi:hypothetical protein